MDQAYDYDEVLCRLNLAVNNNTCWLLKDHGYDSSDNFMWKSHGSELIVFEDYIALQYTDTYYYFDSDYYASVYSLLIDTTDSSLPMNVYKLSNNADNMYYYYGSYNIQSFANFNRLTNESYFHGFESDVNGANYIYRGFICNAYDQSNRYLFSFTHTQA